MAKNGYAAHKKWRKGHPETRNAGRKRHYEQSRPGARNSKERWTTEHDALIIADGRPSDRQLAAQLGRSMQAIQIRRMRILAEQ